MSGFGKNSVSKFWKNKKLNVLDMGYTLFLWKKPWKYGILVAEKT